MNTVIPSKGIAKSPTLLTGLGQIYTPMNTYGIEVACISCIHMSRHRQQYRMPVRVMFVNCITNSMEYRLIIVRSYMYLVVLHILLASDLFFLWLNLLLLQVELDQFLGCQVVYRFLIFFCYLSLTSYISCQQMVDLFFPDMFLASSSSPRIS